MYEDFYEFKERPFKLLPDPGYLFLSHQHRLALVHLEYGLLNFAGFVVVTGEIGTGKTTLIKSLLQRLDKATLVASIFNTTVGPDDFLSLILQDLEQEPAGPSRADKIEQLNKFLISSYAQGLRVVLIVDEAQNLSYQTLEEIRLMSNLQTDKDYLIQIILVGQPELREKLSHSTLRQLAQRISVHYHLNPLTSEETKAYILHRLNIGGGKKAEDVFTLQALETIYTHTQGTPRLINLLCDACLVHGFADQIRPITAPDIKKVVDSKEDGSFWSLASSGTSDLQDNIHEASDKPLAPENDNSKSEALENQVRELQNNVLVLNRLVNERLLSEEIAPKQKTNDTERQLLHFLDEEREKVKRLSRERRRLLKEIAELTAPAPKDTGQEKGRSISAGSQRRKLWPWKSRQKL